VGIGSGLGLPRRKGATIEFWYRRCEGEGSVPGKRLVNFGNTVKGDNYLGIRGAFIKKPSFWGALPKRRGM